jgi:ABC-type branched-subunit amino acid transport system substrate-binding protein
MRAESTGGNKMHHVIRRSAPFVLLAIVTSLAACTSPTSSKTSTTGNTAGGGGATTVANTSTVGITADSVKISMIAADLSILSKQHLAPDLGDPVKVGEAVVAWINANGGIGNGRKLVLTTHVIPNAPIAAAEVLQQACVQATEEDKPLAVIITAAVIDPVVQCVSVAHDQLAITMDSWTKKMYSDSGGRIFSVGTGLSVDIEREYSYWPTLLDVSHALDGKTLGIIAQDQPSNQTAAVKALKAALQKRGEKVAAEAIAPYPEGSQTCTQPDVAIERMQQAKVDVVFLIAQNLCAAALVKAAQDANFKPQWATIGNNVTDTVAQFMAPAKGNYDGAWGVGTTFPNNKNAADCNAIAAKAGLHYTPGTDAYSFAALTCTQIETLATALKAAKQPLTQGAVINALQAMATVPMIAGPPGSLSATKHDAGDYVFIEKYSAAQGKFVPFDTTPRRVP